MSEHQGQTMKECTRGRGVGDKKLAEVGCRRRWGVVKGVELADETEEAVSER